MASSLKQLRSKLRDFALRLPEVTEDLPWGERALKVSKKVFVFMGRDMDPGLHLGIKLNASHSAALATPQVTRMRYGLGKSGWVSAQFDSSEHPPFETLRDWVSESYRAVAPKKLATQLPAVPSAVAEKKRTAKKAPAPRKAAAARAKPRSAPVSAHRKKRTQKR